SSSAVSHLASLFVSLYFSCYVPPLSLSPYTTLFRSTPFAAGCTQKIVVFGVLAAGLKQIVVHVLDRHFGLCALQAQCLQLQHHHRARGVLGERLVDSQGDFGAGRHLAGHQMGGNELLRNVVSHISTVDGCGYQRSLVAMRSAIASPAPHRPPPSGQRRRSRRRASPDFRVRRPRAPDSGPPRGFAAARSTLGPRPSARRI